MNKYEDRVKELGGTFVNSLEEDFILTLSEEQRQQLMVDTLQPSTYRVHPSQEEVHSLEQALGYPLPSDYREFLMGFGGYAFSNVVYPVQYPSGTGTRDLHCFYGIGIGASFDLLHKYRRDLANWVIAPEFLPIARDYADSQVGVFLAGEQRGTIHFWEIEEATAPYNYANLYFIANSFDEFMHLLRKRED